MRWRVALSEAGHRELSRIGQQIANVAPPTLAEVRTGALRASMHAQILRNTETGELFIPVGKAASMTFARGGPVRGPAPFILDRQPCPSEVITRGRATAQEALGGCPHDNPEPVELNTGEVVAAVCPACLVALSPSWVGSDWKP